MTTAKPDRFQGLLDRTKDAAPAITAVVHPCDERSLTGAVRSAEAGLITPILVGPRGKIISAGQAAGIDLAACEIVDVPHSHAAADRAVELVHEGRAEALMKGKLHTEEFMGPIVTKDGGLRTDRRMSHIFVQDAPSYHKLLFVTDAALNIDPDLAAMRDIAQNAIDLARSMGVETPKVAILSAVEMVEPSIPSTIEAAALCKMHDRGQLKGGLIDGPLAIDNAISKEAAAVKGLTSPVAGDADVLVAPDLEAGNMIAKQLTYLAGARTAGVVMGARVPIILTSRADGVEARIWSSMLALFALRGAVETIS